MSEAEHYDREYTDTELGMTAPAVDDAGKWGEMHQLQIALAALQTQPYEAQLRMIEWLWARIQDDESKAIQKRKDKAK